MSAYLLIGKLGERMDYKIMHEDKIIALANENGIYEIIDKSLCPACFAMGMPLEIWLSNRSIDPRRTHSRKLFNVSSKEKISQ